MKAFTIIQGIRIRRLMMLVLRHGLTPLPVYLLRFLVLCWGALPSSILTRVESIRYGRAVRNSRLEHPPIFIVGHWRTGSTFLHQLLNIHPEFTAPTMVQTSIPDHFLFSTPYYLPILKKALPGKRPMDNVALGPLEPQEEEFALLRLGAYTPFEKLLFPSSADYFLAGVPYLPSGRALEKWKEKLDRFFRKIQVETGKRIVSKNPWHSLRMPLLAGMYPGARFIHITRDPLEVVPSTIRMWDMLARDNALKRGWTTPSCRAVCQELHRFLEEIRQSAGGLKPGHYAEVAFEDLEKDPAGTLRKLFPELGLDFSPDYEELLRQYMAGLTGYRKNQHVLSPEDRACILEIMSGSGSAFDDLPFPAKSGQ